MAQSKLDCRSPVGLDCCNCCLDLANRSDVQSGSPGDRNPVSPTVSNFRQLQEKLVFENLNADKLDSIMRQDSLEPVLRDPCYLINEGICNRNIDQTMLSILLFFHRVPEIFCHCFQMKKSPSKWLFYFSCTSFSWCYFALVNLSYPYLPLSSHHLLCSLGCLRSQRGGPRQQD
ncbi:hypothetical protein LEMLEM_LOCUS17631 [Lemmus lemmus]